MKITDVDALSNSRVAYTVFRVGPFGSTDPLDNSKIQFSFSKLYFYERILLYRFCESNSVYSLLWIQ